MTEKMDSKNYDPIHLIFEISTHVEKTNSSTSFDQLVKTTLQRRVGRCHDENTKKLAKAIKDATDLIVHLQLRTFEKGELNEEPDVSGDLCQSVHIG